MDLKGTPQKGLLSTTLGFFFGFAAISLYGPTAKFFREAMELTPSMVGLLVAMPSLSGSLLRIPFGAWVETTGWKKPFLILLLLSVIGLGGITTILYISYPQGMDSGLYPVILFFGFLSGCGIATFSVGIGQTSYWFTKDKQGFALGTYAGLGNLAPGLFSLLIPVVLAELGIVEVYFSWFLFLLIGTIIYLAISENAYFFQLQKSGHSKDESMKLAQEKGQELFPTGSAFNSIKTAAKNIKTWALVAIYFTTFGGFIALTAWFPTFWNEYYSLEVVTAGALTAAYSLLASAIRVPGGTLSDKFGGEKVGIISLAIMLIGALILTFGLSFALSLTGAIVLAIGMGITNAAVFKLVSAYVPEAVGGTAGLVGGLGAFGGFAIPPIMGSFVTLFGKVGYASGFSVFIVLAVISGGIIYFLHSGRNTASEKFKLGKELESSKLD